MYPTEYQKEFERELDKRQNDIEKRNRKLRWATKNRAQVIHPAYGSVIVPHLSNLSAIICAAEIWKCEWYKILDAEVRFLENANQ